MLTRIVVVVIILVLVAAALPTLLKLVGGYNYYMDTMDSLVEDGETGTLQGAVDGFCDRLDSIDVDCEIR